MSYTNHTENYDLPQWIGTDKPTFLGDFNGAFYTIDGAIKSASDSATSAVNTANNAATTANTASTNATTALTTANTAKNTADAASSASETAVNKANQALTASQSAETAAAANTITNLAPAYDPLLTYGVDDLVTYVDAQGSGKLYKNIVPIAVPEEFNINKWDDVTTSEVYGRVAKLLSTYACDGTTSYKTAMDALGSGVDFSTDKEYLLIANVGTTEAVFHSRAITNTTAEFNTTSVNAALTKMIVDIYTISNANNSKGQAVTIEADNVTFLDFSNDTASERTYKLYELSTV